MFYLQVRGKKNLVLERGLAGPINLFVKFSTLQEYGVDKLFFLENGNADVSQRNVVFIARGESARHAQAIAGMYSWSMNFPFRFSDDPMFNGLLK
jgi:hypothetical protein